MIVFLTLCYCAVLALFVKLGVIRLTTFWKISPLLWGVLLLIFLLIPMQWGAPSGRAQLFQYVVEIVPNVSGPVIEVPIEGLEPLKKGDVLFKIDPVPFQAAVDEIEANLDLARRRFEQSEKLAGRDAGSVYDVEQYESQIEQLEAKLDTAQFNLDSTVVRAPADGYVIGLTLQPGQRVTSMPLRGWMAFVVTTKKLTTLIAQNYLRHVHPGQEAEVTFQMLPGRTLKARVDEIAPMIGQGQLAPAGTAPTTMAAPQPGGPFGVLLELEDASVLESELFGGAAGTAAIYTQSAGFTHIIRRIMLRMEAWVNYVIPS